MSPTCLNCALPATVVYDGLCYRCAPPVSAPKCATCGERSRFPGMTRCGLCILSDGARRVALVLLVAFAASCGDCPPGYAPDAAPNDAAVCMEGTAPPSLCESCEEIGGCCWMVRPAVEVYAGACCAQVCCNQIGWPVCPPSDAGGP